MSREAVEDDDEPTLLVHRLSQRGGAEAQAEKGMMMIDRN
jgi:hypothetical protein